jgi:hypothetical protein
MPGLRNQLLFGCEVEQSARPEGSPLEGGPDNLRSGAERGLVLALDLGAEVKSGRAHGAHLSTAQRQRLEVASFGPPRPAHPVRAQAIAVSIDQLRRPLEAGILRGIDLPKIIRRAGALASPECTRAHQVVLPPRRLPSPRIRAAVASRSTYGSFPT